MNTVDKTAETRVLKFRVWRVFEKTMLSNDWLMSAAVSCHTLFGGGRTDIRVMQFTGLHDKHGKEIYEGDILEHVYKNTTVFRVMVIFEDGCFVVKESLTSDDPTCLFERTHFKIIGNIYEHPNLLNH
jgi:hypothetical protein